jgi:hypothetical protein
LGHVVWYQFTYVSEALAAFITKVMITLKMEAESTPKTPVNF